jgi:DEAD/DEAH box helicase
VLAVVTQAESLQHLLNGFDLLGRARTGCGKTLAFVLPIVNRMLSSHKAAGAEKRPFGRAPSVIVLAPTRELAKQARIAHGRTDNPHHANPYQCLPQTGRRADGGTRERSSRVACMMLDVLLVVPVYLVGTA